MNHSILLQTTSHLYRFALQEVQTVGRVVWRSSTMVSGALSVMTRGPTLTLL